MKQREAGNNFFWGIAKTPGKFATRRAALIEIIQHQLVVASRQRDFARLLPNTVDPAIIHYLFAIDRETRAIIGFQIKSVFGRLGDAQQPGPPYVASSSYRNQICAWVWEIDPL